MYVVDDKRTDCKRSIRGKPIGWAEDKRITVGVSCERKASIYHWME